MLKDEPSNAVEETIQLLFNKARGMDPVGMHGVVGCEWWAHKRAHREMWSSGAHQLHFDTDERTFAPTNAPGGGGGAAAVAATPLTHPRVSSILYLSGEDAGGGSGGGGSSGGAGPTLITDKEPGTIGLGTKGLLAW